MQPPGEAKSNKELVAALAAAAGLTDNAAASVAGQITWRDGRADGKADCYIAFGGGQPTRVGGGRLGRDHTLDDVPNHYVRDCLIDYITSTIADTPKQQAVARAVFPDLTASEITLYARAQQDLREQRAAAEEAAATATAPPPRRADKLTDALDAIDLPDEDEDEYETRYVLAPGTRDYDRYPPIKRSVLEPGQPMTAEEEDYLVLFGHSGQVGIGQDCDQVRAKVRRFVHEGLWSIEEFRVAVDVTRAQMLAFLRGRGPGAGKASLAYQRSWEFFERREGVEDMEDMEEMEVREELEATGVYEQMRVYEQMIADGKRPGGETSGRKRGREPGGGDSPGKKRPSLGSPPQTGEEVSDRRA